MSHPRKKYGRKSPPRTGTTTLKETIHELLDTYRLAGKYRELHVINAWARLMGPPIADRTDRVFINERKLYVDLNSAPLKHQLSMAKSKIITMINQDAGEEVIVEVVFL
ncbi:MAG: DUF721 domain-containing protein [Catalinimonas sp.]